MWCWYRVDIHFVTLVLYERENVADFVVRWYTTSYECSLLLKMLCLSSNKYDWNLPFCFVIFQLIERLFTITSTSKKMCFLHVLRILQSLFLSDRPSTREAIRKSKVLRDFLESGNQVYVPTTVREPQSQYITTVWQLVHWWRMIKLKNSRCFVNSLNKSDFHEKVYRSTDRVVHRTSMFSLKYASHRIDVELLSSSRRDTAWLEGTTSPSVKTVPLIFQRDIVSQKS
jgi:hypothetical protein